MVSWRKLSMLNCLKLRSASLSLSWYTCQNTSRFRHPRIDKESKKRFRQQKTAFQQQAASKKVCLFYYYLTFQKATCSYLTVLFPDTTHWYYYTATPYSVDVVFCSLLIEAECFTKHAFLANKPTPPTILSPSSGAFNTSLVQLLRTYAITWIYIHRDMNMTRMTRYGCLQISPTHNDIVFYGHLTFFMQPNFHWESGNKTYRYLTKLIIWGFLKLRFEQLINFSL